MLIMAASNNEKHFGATKKFPPDFVRILSTYNEEELKIAIPFMVDKENPESIVPMDIILRRAKIVGNMPRYIISKDSFEYRKSETSAFIYRLSRQQIKEKAKGMNDENSTVHGCIFAVNVKLQCDDGESDKIEVTRADFNHTQKLAPKL